jgi:selenocysteine lyase/cysteine desulfurase
LEKAPSDILKIGSFSAGSNLTGTIFNVDRISYMLHKHDALAFFDYACVGPYVKINMNGLSDFDDNDQIFQNDEEKIKLTYKDAIFLSPHKFIGGPCTAGVMIAKRVLFQNTIPAIPGGGTVFCVNNKFHIYLKDIEAREEGGTPNIVSCIR